MDAIGLNRIIILLAITSRASLDYSEDASQLSKSTVDFIVQQMINTELKDLNTFVERIRSGRTRRSSGNDIQETIAELASECKDALSMKRCRYLMDFKACITHKARMEILCAYTCGFCGGPKDCRQSEFGCCQDGVTRALGRKYWKCPDQCTDALEERFCRLIQKNGFCTAKSNQIYRKCLKTCGFCRPCVDQDPVKCTLMAKNSLCHTMPHQATTTCRATCHRCGTRDPCYGYQCPAGFKCQTDHEGQPYCSCKAHCLMGEMFTGTVCSRGNKEYRSLCHFKQETCLEKTPIAIKNYGSCAEDSLLTGFDSEILKLERLCETGEDHPSCQLHTSLNDSCQSNSTFMMEVCPIACGHCALIRKGFLPGYLNNRVPCGQTAYGCCLDGVTPALGLNCQGCPEKPECVDKLQGFCKKFLPVCGLPHSRRSMMHVCPATCSYCKKD